MKVCPNIYRPTPPPIEVVVQTNTVCNDSVQEAPIQCNDSVQEAPIQRYTHQALIKVKDRAVVEVMCPAEYLKPCSSKAADYPPAPPAPPTPLLSVADYGDYSFKDHQQSHTPPLCHSPSAPPLYSALYCEDEDADDESSTATQLSIAQTQQRRWQVVYL